MNRYPSFCDAFLAINFTCAAYETSLDTDTPKADNESVVSISVASEASKFNSLRIGKMLFKNANEVKFSNRFLCEISRLFLWSIEIQLV